MMARLPPTAALAGLLALALPGPAVHGQDRSAARPDAVERAALEVLRRALAEALLGLPNYAAPEVNAIGDIIIRRVPVPTPPVAPRARPTVRPDEIST